MTRLSLEKFENGVEIFQDETLYKFTADAISLAKFCSIKGSDNVLDMCAGSGVIGLYAYSIKPFNKLYFNDIQPCMCELITKNVDRNKIEEKCKVICKDLCDLQRADFEKCLDVIVCNPPYFKLNSGDMKQDRSIAMCRHEIATNLGKIIFKAGELIKESGKFYLCIPADRMSEAIVLLEENKFATKRMQIIFNRKEARLCLLESVKNGKSGVRITMIEEGL